MIHAEQLENWTSRRTPMTEHDFSCFCLPYAGEGTLPFRKWPLRMPPEVEVCLIYLPSSERHLFKRPVDRLCRSRAPVSPLRTANPSFTRFRVYRVAQESQGYVWGNFIKF